MESFEMVVTAPTDKLREAWVQVLADVLTELVGGCSVYLGSGMWKNEEGHLVNEPHYKLQAWCGDIEAHEVFSLMSNTISNYKENCAQEMVLVVLDGKPAFLREIPSAIYS